MSRLGKIGGSAGVSLVALALALSPAAGASGGPKPRESRAAAASGGMLSVFTPAASDPRLAAAVARSGAQGNFRFTPTAPAIDRGRPVRVAVRARTGEGGAARTVTGSGSAVTAITPLAYNLGAAVGWKRFALSGDVARTSEGLLPGSREAAEVGVAYAGRKFATSVQVAAERAQGAQRLVGADASYSVDLGGSYSIARNLDVTGGVRYKIQRDRLEPLVDQRRDSQAVYLGTAFRF